MGRRARSTAASELVNAMTFDPDDPTPPREPGAEKREHPNDPLHGITLKQVLEHLVEVLGWEQMAREVNVNCFKNDPSLTSSLKFLRKVPWARSRVEELYLRVVRPHEW